MNSLINRLTLALCAFDVDQVPESLQELPTMVLEETPDTLNEAQWVDAKNFLSTVLKEQENADLHVEYGALLRDIENAGH